MRLRCAWPLLREEDERPLRGVREERLARQTDDREDARALDEPAAERREGRAARLVVREHDAEPPARTQQRERALEEEHVALGSPHEARDLEAVRRRAAGERRVRRDDVGDGELGAAQPIASLDGPRIGGRREREQPRDPDRADVHVTPVRLRARSARMREERSRAARGIDDDLALRRREHPHDEVDDVTRREELPLVRLRDARNERLEDRIEGALARERAREELVDAREERIARLRHRIHLEHGMPAHGLGNRATKRQPSPHGNPRGGDGEDDLEGVFAARRDDDLLDMTEDARGAHARPVPLRHRPGTYATRLEKTREKRCRSR